MPPHSGATFVLRKLFTHHDSRNVHKTFGFAALLHFFVRLRHAGAHDMAFGGDDLTLLCIGWHAALSLTSLIFDITKKRILSNTAMIWPEYRLHSILFALRSLASMAALWYEARYHPGDASARFGPLWNVGLVFATMAGASAASHYFPSGTATSAAHRGGSVRDLDAPAWFKKVFSNMQFNLTAVALLGVRRFSCHFMATWIIQVSAFLMTLRRKNLAGHRFTVGTYALLLVAGFPVTTYDLVSTGHFLHCHTLGNVAFSLRVFGGLDKFVCWGAAAALMTLLRATGAVDSTPAMLALFVATTLAKVLLGRASQTPVPAAAAVNESAKKKSS